MKTIRLLLLIAVIACGAVLVQHHGQAWGGGHSVHDVINNSHQLIGTEITVTGVAGEGYAILGAGGFQLRDEDGSTLIVLSSHGMPLAGTRITLHGTLRQAFASGSEQKLVLVEAPQPPKEDETKR
jgi:hypothetical protein